MKITSIISVVLILTVMAVNAQQKINEEILKGKFTDERDGREYNWVMIGSQVWMAENLNISVIINARTGQITNNTIRKLCYDDDEINCLAYGGLYGWDVIDQYIITEGIRSICPEGWHLPTDEEWQVMVDYLGGSGAAGGPLKETGTTHWDKPNKGATNSSGFSALAGGLFSRDLGGFINKGGVGHFWTSSLNSLYSQESNTYLTRFLLKGNARVLKDRGSEGTAYSVRCIKD